jgi:hypothetical protein
VKRDAIYSTIRHAQEAKHPEDQLQPVESTVHLRKRAKGLSEMREPGPATMERNLAREGGANCDAAHNPCLLGLFSAALISPFSPVLSGIARLALSNGRDSRGICA